MSSNQFRWLPALRDLDEEQKKVIYNSLNKGRTLIYGPAGCGKTAITLFCAKTLQDLGKTYFIFTYTNVLLHFIEAAADELGIPSNRINTFYKWVYSEHEKHIGPPPDDMEDKFSLWVDNLIKFYDDNPDKIPHFDYLLIDEAQDFKQNVARLLHMMSDNIFIAGDTSQSIYTEVDTIQEFADIWQPLSNEFELVNNYRNPKTVARVAALFLDGSSISADEFLTRTKGRDYEMKPVWYQVNTLEEQTDRVISIIKQARGSVRIGILFRRLKDLQTEEYMLSKRGVNIQVALRDNAYNFCSALPTLTTIHSAKGLEFDWVILPFLNKDVWDGGMDDIKNRRLFFVALTRTKSNLYLISLTNQECTYLREIVAHNPNLLQSPSTENSMRIKSHSSAYVKDDDPF